MLLPTLFQRLSAQSQLQQISLNHDYITGEVSPIQKRLQLKLLL
ncbi:hypothetical protein [Anabaena azotica]|nr:hypothetical protein [Anabaena azotica]